MDQARLIKGTIEMADGSVSEFQIMPGGTWSQWGADKERLGRSLDVVDAMTQGLVEQDLIVMDGDEPREDVTRQKHNADVNAKHEALKLIREAYPTAVAALFETSDQGHYGFWLQAVELPGLEHAEHSGQLADEVNDLLCDVDWDDVMDETPQGYARVEIASGYVTVSLDIDNGYATGEALTRVTDVLVPAPPATQREADDEGWGEWAQAALYPYTGTGQSEGDSSYSVRVTASGAPTLVGHLFEF